MSSQLESLNSVQAAKRKVYFPYQVNGEFYTLDGVGKKICH